MNIFLISGITNHVKWTWYVNTKTKTDHNQFLIKSQWDGITTKKITLHFKELSEAPKTDTVHDFEMARHLLYQR